MTDGGFRIVGEGDGATCTLELHHKTQLIQLANADVEVLRFCATAAA